jgi:hypothetical protein
VAIAARGGHKFALQAARISGSTAQKLGRSRRGNWQQSVRSLHLARAHIQRRTSEFVDAQHFETDRRAHDVDNRIDGADFMKVNLFDGNLMNASLGFGQPRENLAGAFGRARC